MSFSSKTFLSFYIESLFFFLYFYIESFPLGLIATRPLEKSLGSHHCRLLSVSVGISMV